jgi:hypothetical protein
MCSNADYCYGENMNKFPKSRLRNISVAMLLAQNTSSIFAHTNVDISPPPMVASGSYSNGTNVYPLLAKSMDGGVSWSYAIDSLTPTLPNGTTSGHFTSANCSGQTCLAAGQYSNDSKVYPLLALSTDGGASWSYRIDLRTGQKSYSRSTQCINV